MQKSTCYGRRVIALCLTVTLLSCVPHAHAFAFDLPATATRCFLEEIPSNTELRVLYVASHGYAQFVDVTINGPRGHTYYSTTAQDRGNFHEYISEGGEFSICFNSRMAEGVKHTKGMKRTISVDIMTGNGKNDYSEFATKSKLRPIEVELRAIEDSVHSIHTEYLYYKEKEAEMRNANEWITSMITGLLAFLLVTFFLFSLWELHYLKSYFKKKRLID